MNILCVIDNYEPYTFNERSLSYALSIKALKDNNHKVTTLTTFNKDNFYFDKTKGIFYFPSTKLNNLFFQLTSAKSFFSIMKSLKIDVIHVFSFSKLHKLVTYISKKYDIPIVRMIDDADIKNDENIAEYIVHSLKRKDEVRKNLLSSYINVINFGVDIASFDPNELDKFRIKVKRNELRINETTKVLISLASISSKEVIKGYYDFIITHPELDVILLIINSDTSLPDLFDLVKSLHIDSRVRFISKPSALDLSILFKLSSYFIGDNSTNNIVPYLYAFNSETIVLTSYNASLFSLVKENETGFYYKDASSLAKEMYRLFNLDDKKRSEIINLAKESAMKYSLDRFYKETIKVYERAIKSKW